MQWFLAEYSLAMSSLTLSSRLRYFGIRFGILGVSKSSATLLSMARALFFRYFQNWRIDTIFLACVPALALLSIWQWEIKAYILFSSIGLIKSVSIILKSYFVRSIFRLLQRNSKNISISVRYSMTVFKERPLITVRNRSQNDGINIPLTVENCYNFLAFQNFLSWFWQQKKTRVIPSFLCLLNFNY